MVAICWYYDLLLGIVVGFITVHLYSFFVMCVCVCYVCVCVCARARTHACYMCVCQCFRCHFITSRCHFTTSRCHFTTSQWFRCHEFLLLFLEVCTCAHLHVCVCVYRHFFKEIRRVCCHELRGLWFQCHWISSWLREFVSVLLFLFPLQTRELFSAPAPRRRHWIFWIFFFEGVGAVTLFVACDSAATEAQVSERERARACVRVCVCACTQPCIHACIHAYIHMHACIHTYTHTHIHTYTHA